MRPRNKPSSRRRYNQSRLGKFENLEPRVVLDARLLITEFVADNDNSLLDEDGDDPDWVEIFNAGEDLVNVEGWHLTDDPNDLGKSELGSRDILPGEYLVVFASGKDRDDPLNGNLHTNFQLDSAGEYLALTRPDESIAFEYAPSFPSQVEDVAYGIPSAVTRTTLISTGAAAKFDIPTDGSVDPDLANEAVAGSWIDPTYDDSQWNDAVTGIGYWDESNDPNPKPGDGTLIADSVAEFSDTQNADNWRYGYWIASDDDDGVYDAESDFRSFIKLTFLPSLNGWNVDDMIWDLKVRSPNSQNTELRSDGALPAGSNSGTEVHHPIRRWISEVTGGVLIHGTIDNPDPAGDGVIARILIDGEEIYRREFNGNSAAFTVIRQVAEDQKVDFVLDPGQLGNDAGDNTLWDITVEDVTPFVGELEGVPTLADDISTDIEDQMKGVGSSAYIRIPFTPDTVDYDSLSLRVKYQDGFVAYLNGEEVARSPSAGEAYATWQTVASSERTVPEAKQFEAFNVTAGLSRLSPGTPAVLMVQALNISTDDDNLLLVPELLGTKLVIDETDTRYFPTATPGEQNGLGTEEVGPLFTDTTHSPNVPVDSESIVVSTHVDETFHAIANVTLNYRVMYGATSQVEMVDDGTGGDIDAGDGVYAATIPGGIAQPGEMVRWFMFATDADGNESRFPLFEDTLDSEEYFGTVLFDPELTSINPDLTVFQTFFENPSLKNNPTGTFGSVFYDGEFYDNVRFDRHGQSTGGFPKKSLDVNFPEDHRFRLRDDIPRYKKFNLLSNYADKARMRNPLAWHTRELTGTPSALSFPVLTFENGEFFSLADFVEDADDRFLERIGLDPRNPVYKLYTGSSSDNSKAEKKTARHIPGNDDLVEFNDGLKSNSGDALREFIYDNVDLAAMANYLAGFTVTSNRDCCHKNYYAYRDTSGSGEWSFFPWDVDLSYGRNWTSRDSLAYHDYTIYYNNGLKVGSNNGSSFLDGNLIAKLYAINEFEDMYFRRMRTLMDDIYGDPDAGNTTIEDYVQQLKDLIGPWGQEDLDKFGQVSSGRPDQPFETWEVAVNKILNDYLVPRREYLASLSSIPDQQVDDAVIEIAGLDFNPVSGNQDEEYIQLTNNNNFAVDITDWKLAGGVSMTFRPGTVISSGGSLYVTPDATAFRARATGPSGGQSLFVQGGYNGHLSSFGETIELVRRDGTTSTTFTYPGDSSPAQRFLRITEVMYNPLAPSATESAIDAGFDNDDFEYAELANISTTETLDLSNVRFTSGFQFDFTDSDVTSLAPGERVLVVRDLAAFHARYGSDFDAIIAGTFSDGTLNNGGEAIKLEDATNSTVVEFSYDDDADSQWPERADGRGSSLQVIDTTGDYGNPANWRPSTELNGSPGTVGGVEERGLVINEFLSNSDLPSVDQIELVNTTDSPISLVDYYLSDRATSVDSLQSYQLPSVMLAPGQHVVFDESHFNFGLSSLEDEIYLTVGDGSQAAHFADFVKFGAIATGESYGRFPNATGPMVPMSQTTFGATNSAPRIGPVIISEVQYNPGEPTAADLAIDPTMEENDLEFVEIHNTLASEILLTEWRIRGGVDLDFDAGSTLAAGETVVVVSFNPDNPDNANRGAAFRSHYAIDESVRLIGGYSGRLNDGGERVTLQRPGTPLEGETSIPRLLEDEVRYSDSAPWTPDADGTGSSLTRVSPTLIGNNNTSWMAAAPTPGSVDFSNIPGDTNQDGMVDSTDIDALFNAINAGNNDDAFDVNDSGDVNLDDVTHLVERILSTFMGDANLDGAVNVSDLNQVGTHWQQTSGANWATGDFTGDEAVTASDLNVLALNWQQGAVQAANHVRTPRAPLADHVAAVAHFESAINGLGRGDEHGVVIAEDTASDPADGPLRRRAFKSRHARRQRSSGRTQQDFEYFASLSDDALVDWDV